MAGLLSLACLLYIYNGLMANMLCPVVESSEFIRSLIDVRDWKALGAGTIYLPGVRVNTPLRVSAVVTPLRMYTFSPV